jgi:hypothetical protein
VAAVADDQLGDAENAGFNPYEHEQRKREQAMNAAEATAAAEHAIVEQYTPRIGAEAAMIIAPEIARRDALINQLRAHLTAEADKLAAQPDRTMTAPSVAAVLRAIVEASR